MGAMPALPNRPRRLAMDELTKRREMNERNARVQARYDELMREGRHGHYETMFRVVREEVERALNRTDT